MPAPSVNSTDLSPLLVSQLLVSQDARRVERSLAARQLPIPDESAARAPDPAPVAFVAATAQRLPTPIAALPSDRPKQRGAPAGTRPQRRRRGTDRPR